MKILFVIDSLVGGGAQRQLVNVAIGLRARAHDVTVFTYHPNDWHRHRLVSGGVAQVFHLKKGRFDPGPIRALRRLVHQARPDVVVAFLRTPSFYAEVLRAFDRSLPVIVSERAGVEARGLRPTDLLAGVGHLMASHVTANSHDYLERLARVLPIRGRMSVIYNGLEPSFLERGSLALVRSERAEGDDASPENRLCVVAARVTRQKGPMPLVQALGQLKAEGRDFRLDWIGPIDETTALVAQVRESISSLGLGSCWRWLGPESDIAQAYGRYEAFVLPSVFEGVANTMCEAMACGLPVIVTDIADNGRIVRDGVDGFVCKSDDPRALAQAIDRFLKLDETARRAMGASAHARARELFSMDKLIGAWEALCVRVIGRSH